MEGDETPYTQTVVENDTESKNSREHSHGVSPNSDSDNEEAGPSGGVQHWRARAILAENLNEQLSDYVNDLRREVESGSRDSFWSSLSPSGVDTPPLTLSSLLEQREGEVAECRERIRQLEALLAKEKSKVARLSAEWEDVTDREIALKRENAELHAANQQLKASFSMAMERLHAYEKKYKKFR